MSIGRFYGGVAALIWSPDDRYLLLRRSAEKDYAAGTWECVTGRVDQGEGFETALRREVREELGVAVQIEFIIGTTHFYRGQPRPENELLGILYGCTLDAPNAVTISPEHSEYRWVTAAQANALLAADNSASKWLREAIDRAEKMKKLLPSTLSDFYREHGFEVG